jgi:uncharacterized damage-inducible protein DinB
MTAELIRMMTRYNLWANTLYTTYFSTQDPAKLEAHVASSFPSIAKTLLHIWDAQDIWHRRLHGEVPTTFRKYTGRDMHAAIFEGLVETADRFVELADRCTSEDFQEILHFSTILGGPQSSRRYEIILHVCNHSTYHRGQCITMARALEMQDLPGTDLIRFLRNAQT